MTAQGARFTGETAAALAAQGWRLLHSPAGVTLAALQQVGAPFKGTRHLHLATLPTGGGDVAYRPGLLPDSLNCTFAAAADLVSGLERRLPPGAAPVIGAAALYAWLLIEHHRQHGEWLLRQVLTWTADPVGPTHLAIGVFGQARPLVVSPIPELTGAGLGAMPLIVPSTSD